MSAPTKTTPGYATVLYYTDVCVYVCAVQPRSSELQVMSTSRRRLSSPIFNPNFEEDFDATTLRTTTVNMDQVLASLSSGLALTSPDRDDDITVTSSTGRDDVSNDVLNDVSCALNRDVNSSVSERAADGTNYGKVRKKVNAVKFSTVIIIVVIVITEKLKKSS